MSASQPRVPPMKPSMSTRPVFMIGPIVLRPEPLMKLTTPGGKAAAMAAEGSCTLGMILAAGEWRSAAYLNYVNEERAEELGWKSQAEMDGRTGDLLEYMVCLMYSFVCEHHVQSRHITVSTFIIAQSADLCILFVASPLHSASPCGHFYLTEKRA